LDAPPEVTIDIGQVMFGQTVTVSSDVMRQFSARGSAHPKKSVIHDGDGNGGGIVPYSYGKDFYGTMQWAIGLELFLLIDDPWRVFFTTDHPNGAPFTVYRRDENIAKMLGQAAYVFKDGALVVQDGEITHYRWGKALRLNPSPDKAMVRRLEDYHQQRYGLSLDWFNFPDSAIAREQPFGEVACRI
ncbi:MAG: formylmethanofuran dehydrogenase subunit A, partial [Mesorhizobium sp.]